jgi:hypothetical protein
MNKSDESDIVKIRVGTVSVHQHSIVEVAGPSTINLQATIVLA